MRMYVQFCPQIAFPVHGPDEKSRKAKLRLDVREGALADLGGYRALEPGKRR